MLFAMKYTKYILAAAALFLTSACDKIDSKEYTVYDGVVINWATGIPMNDNNLTQQVYVEKYTGPRCNNCPKADTTLSTIHNNRVVIISVNHHGGQGDPFPGEPDMRTDGGTAWGKYFGINALPAAFINRDQSTQYQGDMRTIIGAIDQALNRQPVVACEIHATAGTKYAGDLRIQFVQDYTRPITVTIALTEDSLRYKQILPERDQNGNYIFQDDYVHNHMLRKVITGFWGRNVEANGTQGEVVTGSFQFDLPNGVKPENCHIVALVSDKASRKVLNCASCKITE